VLNSFRKGERDGCSREEHFDAPAARENRRSGTVARGHPGLGGGKQGNRSVGAVEELLHAGRNSGEFTGQVQRAFVACLVGKSLVKLHPDFLQQKPAAVLDHTAVNVQHDAVVEVGSVTVSEDFAKPDIFPTSFLVVLANPVLDRFQSGRLGQILERLGQAKHLQLALCHCCEERMCPVNGVDPNERLEPPPFAFLDLAHGLIMFTLVDPFGFNESVLQRGGIGVEGVYDPLQATSVAGTVLEPFIQPSQPLGRVFVPDGVNELRTSQAGIGDDPGDQS